MNPEPSNKRILSGMRSTQPRLHIGNYEGALRNWVSLQNEGYSMFCMVADWHALTTMNDGATSIGHNSREVAKDYVAAGIDPAKSVVFVQSHVKEHAELHLLFSMITPLGWLERVPTYKEKRRDIAAADRSLGHDILVHLNHYEDLSDELQQIAKMFSQKGMRSFADNSSGDIDRTEEVLLKLKKASTNLKRSLAKANTPSGREALQAAKSLEGSTTYLLQVYRKALKDLSEGADSLSRLFHALTQPGYLIANFRSRLQDAAASVTSIPYGLLGYPVLQTADILLYRPLGVPVGKDQAPHLEIGNDIGSRFNRLYDVEIFAPYKYMIPQDETRAKLPGLDMRKMSKSYDNCVYLSDTEDETAAKIKSAFTTPTKMRKTDPGVPEGCAVCQYLKIYSEHWPTQWEEDRLGLRGCMQNKKECTEAVNEYLRPIRERRAQLDDATIDAILRDGAERARAVASETLESVRKAMGLI